MTYYAIYFKAEHVISIGKDYPIIISKDKSLLKENIKNPKEYYIKEIKELPNPGEICAIGQWLETNNGLFVLYENVKAISNEDLEKLLFSTQ